MKGEGTAVSLLFILHPFPQFVQENGLILTRDTNQEPASRV
jgi:hypothetical protein